jgi:hypothetical protein
MVVWLDRVVEVYYLIRTRMYEILANELTLRT